MSVLHDLLCNLGYFVPFIWMIRLVKGLINDNCWKDSCFSDLVIISEDYLRELGLKIVYLGVLIAKRFVICWCRCKVGWKLTAFLLISRFLLLSKWILIKDSLGGFSLHDLWPHPLDFGVWICMPLGYPVSIIGFLFTIGCFQCKLSSILILVVSVYLVGGRFKVVDPFVKI